MAASTPPYSDIAMQFAAPYSIPKVVGTEARDAVSDQAMNGQFHSTSDDLPWLIQPYLEERRSLQLVAADANGRGQRGRSPVFMQNAAL
jgi:hypothetical protein